MASGPVSWTEIKNNVASSLMIEVLLLNGIFLLAALSAYYLLVFSKVDFTT